MSAAAFAKRSWRWQWKNRVSQNRPSHRSLHVLEIKDFWVFFRPAIWRLQGELVH